MRQSEFISATAKKAGLTHDEVDKVIKAMTEVVVETAVNKEEEVMFPFGKFKCKKTAARTGTNPLTGKPLNVQASKTLAFKPAKSIKVIG